MAMLPEYYPGLPEDPYMEYLRKLGQFQRSSSDLPYTSLTNLRIENQYPGGRLPALPDDPVEVMNRNRPLPQFNRLGPQLPAAYSESPVPGTAEMMRARDALNEDADRRADAMIAEAKQRRSRPVQPITPPSMGAPPRTGNVRLPVRTQTSAAQSKSAPAQGLLDTEDAPESGSSWYDDPMRMGLLQAGLGLLSAPQYSTNPNDVTLGSALAKGLGGFVQGYGGTKQRLSEAERQRIEDDWKRTQMEKDFEYKDALIQMYGIQGDAQRKNAELNTTEKQLQKQAIAAQVERILKHEGKLGNTTRRLELYRLGTSDNTNQQNQFADLYRESTADRTPMEETLVASGKYTEEDAKKLRFTALETQYNKILDLQTNPPNPPKDAQGSERERNIAKLTKGLRDPEYQKTPEYADAWFWYKTTELDPRANYDGSVIIQSSDFPPPPGYEPPTLQSGEGRKLSQVGGVTISSKPSDTSQKQINDTLAGLATVQRVEDQLVAIGVPNFEERLKQNDPEVARLASRYGVMLMSIKEVPFNLGVLQELDKQEMQNIIANPTDPKNIRNIMRTLPTFMAQSSTVKQALLDRSAPIAEDYGINLREKFNRTYAPMSLTFDIPANLPKNQSKLDKRTDEILQGTGTIDVAPLQLNNGNDSEVPLYERWYNNLTN
jgi:hypothetical protein